MSCHVRRPLKSHILPTAIISLGFMTRFQIDVVDMRTRPNGEFKWILHCRDHFSNYSRAYLLPSKEAPQIEKSDGKILQESYV